MTGKREAKRTALRQALLKAALTQITQGGSTALRARDLAKQAGCAVGAIYNAFNDLDDLQFHVRAEIFRDMVAWITHNVKSAGATDPKQRLILLATSYLQYAQDNKNAWGALFNSDLAGDDAPQWYLDALGQLMNHITIPLLELKPDLEQSELALTARILFSSVHGVVILNVQQRPSGIQSDALYTAFERIVSAQINYLT
ncbi:MAG: TetR/AcrR family transcriptional regulator [Rhodobacteraceae bacterium]|nr:TetR/AcrR family transcriptional regulator [Paracoccaceae bacterium]